LGPGASPPLDELTVIVVLSEFRAEQVPIVLEEGLEIDELGDQEISAGLAVSQRIGLWGTDSQFISKTFGIRTSFESPLFIEVVPEDEAAKDQAAREAAYARANRALLALRTFKAGRVGTVGTFEYVTGPATGGVVARGSLTPFFGWPGGDPYTLTEEEGAAFRKFWQAFQLAHRHMTTEGALRRFGYSAERTRPDDKIVDLAIAAESLFLSDLGTSDRGELRFRLSTRMALFLEETVDARRRMAKFVRHAYRARSGIVHGGTASDEDVQTLDGSGASLQAFADELEGVVRRALRLAVIRAGANQAFPPDWNELMFSGEPSPTS
jgi:Apea-like HEPN